MDRKRPKPLILRRDTVEGRMVARHIALEEDTPLSHAANQAPDLGEGANQGDQAVAEEEVRKTRGEEALIQLESDMLPLGAEVQMHTVSSDRLVLAQGTREGEGCVDGPPGAWSEPLGEDDFDNEEEMEGRDNERRPDPKRKWRWKVPVQADDDWEDCSALGPGWKRKVVFRRSTTLPAKRKWDTYYCSPCGDRMRSKVELTKYLRGGVDISRFDFQSGLFLDEKSRLKRLNHLEEVHSSSTSTSRTGTPDLDRNHTSDGLPGTPQRTQQSQASFPHITQSPTVVIHNSLPATPKASLASGSPSLRLEQISPQRLSSVASSSRDVVIAHLSQSLLPLSPTKNQLLQSGLQPPSPTKNQLLQSGLQPPSPTKNQLLQSGLQPPSPTKNQLLQSGLQPPSPTKNQLLQSGLQPPSPTKNQLLQSGLQPPSPTKNQLLQSGLQPPSPTKNQRSQLGLQTPEGHRKVVVIRRPDVDLDPITSPPPQHLSLVTQWTQQWSGSNIVLNGHREMDTEKPTCTGRHGQVESVEVTSHRPGSYGERIQQLKTANDKDAEKKQSPSIVFRKVGGDKWVLGGKQLEFKEEEFGNGGKTPLYAKKKRKRFGHKSTKVTRRPSISRKVKMKESVKELEEEEEEEEEEEGEEEEEEVEEKPQKKMRTPQRKKVQVKEKEEEVEWKPEKIVYNHSEGSESEETHEQTNISRITGKLKKRTQGCGQCAPCQRTDCGKCVYCLDKPKNGGANKKKQKCKYRRCLNMPTKRDLMGSFFKNHLTEDPGGQSVPIGLGSVLPGSVPISPGTVVGHGAGYVLLGRTLSKWHMIKPGSGSKVGTGRGRGRPPKHFTKRRRRVWSQVPSSDTTETDETEEEEEPVYTVASQSLEYSPGGEDGERWAELQEYDDDDDVPEQIPQMSPSYMPVNPSSGVSGSDEPYPSSCVQPYPQSCYQSDHGNLQFIRMNGNQITIIPGPSLASQASAVLEPAVEPPSLNYMTSEPSAVKQLRPPLHQPLTEPSSPYTTSRTEPDTLDYTEEEQLVELYAEIPRTVIQLGTPDLPEVTGSTVMPRLTTEVIRDVTPDDVTPEITETFSLADGSESCRDDREAALFGFLRALRRTVLPAHWVGVMARGPLLQLLQCSKLSTMADTVLQILPGFCFQVTVQGQPLLLTHPLYEVHPPRLGTITQLVTLLLDLETLMVCPGFPVRLPALGDRGMEVMEPVLCVRAAICELLVPLEEERCERCRDNIVEEEVELVEEEEEEEEEEDLELVEGRLEFELELGEDGWV
ncbi:methyl-CpG-binding domain protein 1a isoform X4 [Salmo salar]|uniref:Methyl-CpG-binding domain protein 1a isoform X4 n=1 Tax=Salmo salar TaxID=8030 RepID=A0ABM3D110_SALSA|nr:methyl-CpG-binding domain protein 1a isoform X4 [Salmo salar]